MLGLDRLERQLLVPILLYTDLSVSYNESTLGSKQKHKTITYFSI